MEKPNYNFDECTYGQYIKFLPICTINQATFYILDLWNMKPPAGDLTRPSLARVRRINTGTKAELLKSSVMDGPSSRHWVSVSAATANAAEPLQEQWIQNWRRGFTAGHNLSHYGRILPGFMHGGRKIWCVTGSTSRLAGSIIILKLQVLSLTVTRFIYY